ncbi:MAG: hypothetical protein HN390_14550 [Anaerolineae bacterium]|jgi:hypothetical protein|nr:hypothetical protein [Anaerolineae bacterium]
MAKKEKSVAITVAVIGAIAAIIAAIASPLAQNWLEKSSAEEINLQPVTEYFPLFSGTSRTYTVTGKTFADVVDGEIPPVNSTYTETVVMVTSGTNEDIHIYKVEQTGGIIYDLDCTGFETRTAPAEKWYVTDPSRVYVACTQDELGEIIDELMYQTRAPGYPHPNYDEITPILEFPLEVENIWPAFPGQALLEDSVSYARYVEEKLDYSVPAGQFTSCYRIVVYTSSGTSIRYFCDGIGPVAMEYHHYGSPVDFRVELKEFSSPNFP